MSVSPTTRSSSEAGGAAGGAARSRGGAGGATASGSSAGAGGASAPGTLTVSGPVSGGMGKIFSASAADLAGKGYSEKEFFFEGRATAYAAAQGDMAMDGKWTLTEASQADYKSRLIVRRPIDADKFNGSVVVEWLNVSGGADGDPGFMYQSDMLLREGFAFVGVSAQMVGVEGGGFSLGVPGATPLKQYDPARYGSLQHPGDAYAYDIFTQAARAIRNQGELDILEGLKPERLIAYGESQSAGRLVSYINGVHPLVKQYDGFFVHSRGAAGPGFDDAAGPGGFGGTPVLIRDDLSEKVFQFQTETDVIGMLAFLPARQPDSDKLRTWEVAGTAHADTYIIEFNASLLTTGNGVQCAGANDGPQFRVIRAALKSFDTWMRDGSEPPRGELLATDSGGKPMKDEYGNTLGGVRTPDVDVPIRTLSGDPPTTSSGLGSLVCGVFGSVTPFTPDMLMDLYPEHDDYVKKVTASARKTREAGFILEPEEQGFVSDAQNAPVPN